MKGCDFAWGVTPGRERALAAALKAKGFGFVVRYLTADAGKRLTAAEVAAYRAEGLHIVTVYEDTGNALTGGTAVGRAQALTAKEQLHALGAPRHSPVYFAADFNASAGQITEVDAALNEAAYVLSEQMVGIYGGYAMVAGAQHVNYRWQTAAWSAGRWDAKDVLEQPATGGTTDGVQWDLDESVAADFGQWQWPSPHAAPWLAQAETLATQARDDLTTALARSAALSELIRLHQ